MKKLLLALALAAVAVSADARQIRKLYDATSTASGSLDTGSLNTAGCNQIYVLASSTGAAAAASYTVSACRGPATSSCAAFGYTLTAPTAGATTDSGSIGPGQSGGRATAVPLRLRYQITGGAASTATLTIYCEF